MEKFIIYAGLPLNKKTWKTWERNIRPGKPGKFIRNEKKTEKTANFNKNLEIWNELVVNRVIILSN